jgi:formylglycine-generating enzyme required for sulfatase activity/predicted Ser/Thr protein kinase
MRGLERILQAFRGGQLSRDQVLSELDRELALPDIEPADLLGVLHAEHLRARLPPDLHSSIARRIWQQIGGGVTPPSVPQSEKPRSAGPPTDDMRTVVLEPPTLLQGSDSAAVRVDIRTIAVTPGTVLLGRFKLVELVGEGGMSAVFKAVDIRKVEARAANPYIAVKLLTLPFSDYSVSLAVLEREAGRLQNLAHPNIVRVFDCDRDGHIVFMTMEYLEGESLALKYSDAPPPPSEARSILEQIASALSYAHRQGIVHGDLKPGNVLITKDGQVKVIDFGIARILAQSRVGGNLPQAEQWGEVHGLTPAYASPEMIERKAPDPRDDVFALGCIAYELLTGQHPFERQASTRARDAGEKIARHPALSRSQFAAISGALQFEREARTPGVDEFMEQFRDSPIRRHPDRAWAIGAILAALLVGAGVQLLRRADTPDTPATATGVTPRALSPGQNFRDCPTCPLMRVVPAGRFEQGNDAGAGPAAAFERPRHAVAIASPFGIGIHEVTVGEFREFASATGREAAGCDAYDGAWRVRKELDWRNPGYDQSASHPVTCVSWQDAAAYAAWLSSSTGMAYRLPSASEWEYAARAGTASDAPSGQGACLSSNIADASAERRYPGWSALPCDDGYVHSAPVGSFAANPFGLQDMLGNVFEWVGDCWHDDYRNAPADGSARQAPGCRERELRGGSWFTTPEHVRPGYRSRFEETYRSNSIGFRVVRDVQK